MPADLNFLTKTLQAIKQEYEAAIKRGEKTEEIRSQKIINFLRDYAIVELKKSRIPPDWIQPSKVVYGFPKTKEQDILIAPPEGVVYVRRRKVHIGPLMSVNIRSQLSSIEKNYDTLYERLFAEALNLHNEFPYMVLGYIYLMPVVGYDPNQVILNENYNLEKYIVSFSRVNKRKDPSNERWKYERVCLLIVDFEPTPPVIVTDNNYLVKKQRISTDFAQRYNIQDLSISTFFDDLITIFYDRYFELIL
jgi:hypothetical protein